MLSLGFEALFDWRYGVACETRISSSHSFSTCHALGVIFQPPGRFHIVLWFAEGDSNRYKKASPKSPITTMELSDFRRPDSLSGGTKKVFQSSLPPRCQLSLQAFRPPFTGILNLMIHHRKVLVRCTSLREGRMLPVFVNIAMVIFVRSSGYCVLNVSTFCSA